jgi:hypothetical protein
MKKKQRKVSCSRFALGALAGIGINARRRLSSDLNTATTKNTGKMMDSATTKMDLKTAIKVMRTHQSWRLGADIASTNPRTLTQAIEVVLDAAQRFSDNVEAIAAICGEI